VSSVRLVIESNLSDVSLVAVAVNRICVYLGLDEIQADQVELCITEAVTNAILHAYHGESGQTVSIAVSTSADQLHFEVSDSGTPMSAEHVERLIRNSKLFEVEGIDRASLPEGGRGLQIIHDLMDEVAYIRKDNVNRLQLTKRISPGKTD
jgi:serine/threonine-protein kinase RsbW